MSQGRKPVTSMKLKDIRVDMWVETKMGYGQVTRVGGTHPPSVRVRIDQPFPRGVINMVPRDILSEGRAPSAAKGR